MRFLLFAYVATCGAIMLLMDTGQLMAFQSALTATPGGDKLAHFVAAGGLALLVNLTLLETVNWSRRRVLATGAGSVALLCLLEEISNLFTPYRACEFLDVVANCSGILLIGVVPVVLAARASAPRTVT